ncbi:hypothetical protein M011DRAFT_461798 [Sporormia fimetaria CBS 119925]|uniref:Uncharacterized protein n=1 Tax=Sporormia fimetaria CBS 119925 TaxID=1340428 RepID=A0A6A6UZI4_9PLEO|nr:hypothetical protein M011DRAFT_461798 [Sporormia fimetaria CBS 119925]
MSYLDTTRPFHEIEELGTFPLTYRVTFEIESHCFKAGNTKDRLASIHRDVKSHNYNLTERQEKWRGVGQLVTNVLDTHDWLKKIAEAYVANGLANEANKHEKAQEKVRIWKRGMAFAAEQMEHMAGSHYGFSVYPVFKEEITADITIADTLLNLDPWKPLGRRVGAF